MNRRLFNESRVSARRHIKGASRYFRKKQKHKRRTTTFETLEQRQMLSASSWSEPELGVDDTVVSAKAEAPVRLSPTFTIVGGTSQNLFTVSTRLDEAKQPVAILSLKNPATTPEASRHEIVLELSNGPFKVSRHQVTVALTGESFLETYRQDRLVNAQQQLSEVSAKEAADYLANLTKQGEFTDISPFGPRQISETPAVAIELDRLGALAKSADKVFLNSADEKLRFYAGLDTISEKINTQKVRKSEAESGFDSDKSTAATQDVHQLFREGTQADSIVIEPSITPTQKQELRNRLGKIAIELAEQIKADLISADTDVANAAQQARDAFVANANFSDLLWKGYGVNSRLLQEQAANSADVKYSIIYETGEVQLSDRVAINIGQPAVIEMTETPLNRGFSAGRFAANTGATAGPAASVGSDADTYVFNTAPEYTDGAAIEVFSGHGPGLDIDGLFRFNISSFSQYTSTATVELTPTFWQGTSFEQAAEIVASDWDEATTNWNNRPADNPAAPVTTTGGSTTWTVSNGDASVVLLDVSEQVRQKLRQGDLNFDSIKGITGTANDVMADVTAFELAVKDPAAFDAAYSRYLSDDSDLLDRADMNGNGIIDAQDAEAFLAVHGYLQGDQDFDGDVDALGFWDYLTNYGSVASYFEGDTDFSGLIDGGDLDIWTSNYGLTPPDPAEEKISLRVFAPGDQPATLSYVGYGAKENFGTSVRPALQVDQAPNLTLGRFDTTDDGRLQVTYNILNDAMTSFDVEIYRSADGVNYSAGDLLMTHSVTDAAQLQPGLAQLFSFQANFQNDMNSDYRLIAKLVGQSSAGQHEPDVVGFAGGAFQEIDRTVQIHGTDQDDTIDILDSFAPTIDFNDQPLLSYGGSGQDLTPNNHEILDNGNKLRLWGNTWKAIDFDYQVKPNTILEFDFESTVEGEIHGIGFDDNLAISNPWTFQLHGSQHGFGLHDYNNYDPANGVQRYRIPVGQHYTGSFNYLFFANDHDVGSPTGESFFSNVRVYEAPSEVYVRAHGGNDFIDGDQLTTADTYLFGGAGDDYLRGNAGANTLSGQVGSDTYVVPPMSPEFPSIWDAIQSLHESAGDDTYVFEAGRKGISAVIPEAIGLPAGNDTLDFSQLGLGISNFDLNSDNNIVNSNLTLYVAGNSDSAGPADLENVIGTDFDDSITGNHLDNLLFGGDGADIINSLGGKDLIYGGPGDDILNGGDDDDLVFGEDGDDTVRGGDGVDTVSGEIGDDVVVVDPTEGYQDDIVTDIDQELTVADLAGNMNHPPELELPGIQEIDAGVSFSLQLQSTDSDVGQTRSYAALSGLVGDANLPANGLFTWTPTHDDAEQYFEIVVEVTDNGTPVLSDQGILTVFVNQTAPDAPQGLEVVDVTTASVTLTWNSVSGADDYQVERLDPGGTWNPVGNSGGTTSFVDTNVIDGEEYKYRVAALNSAGLSNDSPSIVATTVLIEPTSLTGEYLSGTAEIFLQWNYSGSSQTGFLIERFEDSATGWVEIGNVDATTFDFTDPNITNDFQYFYRVQAVNNKTASGYADNFSPAPTTQSVFVQARTPQTILDDEITAGATSAQVLSGQFDWWHNDEPVALAVEQSLTTAEIIDAGAGHAAGVGSPPQIEFGFDTGTLFNGPGIDAILYLQVDNPGTDSVTVSTAYDNFSLELSGNPVVYDIFGGNSTDFHSGRVSSGEVIPAGYTWRDQLHFDLSVFGVPVGTAVDAVRVQLPANAHIWGMASLSQPLGIDLSINGLDESEEESIGAVVPLNSNSDEGNLDAAGEPVPDFMPDDTAGHRILPAIDGQLVPTTLTLFSHPHDTVSGLLDRTEGNIQLTFDDTKIRVWTVDDFTDELREVTSGADDRFRRFIETEIEYWIEGINESVNPLDVEIRASFTPTFETTHILEDVIKLTVLDIDLDIDANNDDVIDDSDDDVEDIAGVDATPGKVILVNDADIDADGILDYVDGFDHIPGFDGDDVLEGGQFFPLELTIPAEISNPLIEISYSASSPTEIQATTTNPFILPAGHLRIWTEDGPVARDAKDVTEGGDFVAPGRYDLSELNFTDDSTTLYVEAIQESETVADQMVHVLVRDEVTGLEWEDQVRLTATRYEIEAINLEGNWEPVTHYVASTLTEDDAEGLNRAWTSYRVNIHDPRQSGILAVTIEGKDLPLSHTGDHYQTSEFYALTPDSVLPGSAEYVVVSGDFIDWEYNERGKSKFIDILDFNEWDKEITEEVFKAVEDIQHELSTGDLAVPNNNPGWFGSEVDRRVRDVLRERDGWLVDVIVDKDLNVISGTNVEGSTQIDVLRVKAGYNPPPDVDRRINADQIEDLYEIKASFSGNLDEVQRAKLERVLDSGSSNKVRKVKTATSPAVYSFKQKKLFNNPRYGNGLKMLKMLAGVAVFSDSYQAAHGMWTFDPSARDVDKLVASINVAKRAPGSGILKATLWIQTDFREFLTGRFGDSTAVEIAIDALNARAIWDIMQEIEN